MKSLTTSLSVIFILGLSVLLTAAFRPKQAPHRSPLPSLQTQALQDTSHTDLAYFLELKGNIKSNKKGIPEVQLAILADSTLEPYHIYYTDERGAVTMRFELDRVYVVSIFKNGYFSKKIIIDTNVPRGKLYRYLYSFETELFTQPEKQTQLPALFNKPVAHFFYNKQISNFDFDAKYAPRINTEMKRLSEETQK